MATYQDHINEQFSRRATTAQRDFVNQVYGINDVLGHAVKEMIVNGCDVTDVKQRFQRVINIKEI